MQGVIGGVNKQQVAINELVGPVVTSLGYHYVGCEYMPHGPRALIRLYIDVKPIGDEPCAITVEDCAKVSRQVSAVLNVESPVGGDYVLEVSSPGMARKLFFISDFKRFIGSKIALRLVMPKAGKRRLTGQLTGVKEESVVVNVDDVALTISLSEIARAERIVEY